MSLKIKDSQVKAILAEVNEELSQLLKTERDRLAKAAGEESPGEDPSEESSSPASPAGPADAAGPESAPADASASPDASAPPMDASASPAPEAPPAEGAPVEDPAADAGPVDPEALMAEYAKLPPEELKVHYMACKAALAQIMGSADPEVGGGDASAPAPEAPPPAASPAPALKAEVPADMGNRPANGGSQKAAVPDAIKSEKADEGAPLAKSDDKVKELEAKVADQDKQIELLVKGLDLVIGQPMRKAVTGMNYVARAAETKPALTKSEIDAKLGEVIRSRKLTKSESERAISFTLGHIGYEQIKDLLEKK